MPQATKYSSGCKASACSAGYRVVNGVCQGVIPVPWDVVDIEVVTHAHIHLFLTVVRRCEQTRPVMRYEPVHNSPTDFIYDVYFSWLLSIYTA